MLVMCQHVCSAERMQCNARVQCMQVMRWTWSETVNFHGRGQKLSISMKDALFAARKAETIEMCEKSYDLKGVASIAVGKPRA